MKREKMISRIVSPILFVVIAFPVLFPVYWLIITSLKPQSEIFSMPPTFWPNSFTLENYAEVNRNYNILKYFFNSLFLTVVSTVCIMAVASLAAYAISRFDFKGKNVLYISILAAQMVPVVTLLIPLYTFWSGLGAVNSRFSLIVVYTGFFASIAIWLLTSYFEGIPKTIDEAARIDGAGTMRILFTIIVPLAKPGLMAAATTIILNTWQELMIAMTFITGEELRTLPVAVMGFIKSPQGTRWGPMTAAGVMAFIPVFIMYLFMQKYMVKGMTAGAVKG